MDGGAALVRVEAHGEGDELLGRLLDDLHCQLGADGERGRGGLRRDEDVEAVDDARERLLQRLAPEGEVQVDGVAGVVVVGGGGGAGQQAQAVEEVEGVQQEGVQVQLGVAHEVGGQDQQRHGEAVGEGAEDEGEARVRRGEGGVRGQRLAVRAVRGALQQRPEQRLHLEAGGGGVEVHAEGGAPRHQPREQQLSRRGGGCVGGVWIRSIGNGRV